MFAIDTGLRLEEQRALERSDIDLRARQLRVRAEVAKTTKERVIPLVPRAYQLLTAMLLYMYCARPTCSRRKTTSDTRHNRPTSTRRCRRPCVARTGTREERATAHGAREGA